MHTRQGSKRIQDRKITVTRRRWNSLYRTKVKDEDVIIGKVSPPRFLGEFEEFNIATNVKENHQYH